MIEIVQTITQVVGAVAAIYGVLKVRELHVLINSNLARQIKSAVDQAWTQGRSDGIETERNRKEEQR